MTKEELFVKYSINESHGEWDNKIDNWISVELYRIMHNGKLPPPDDKSAIWVCEYLDRLDSDNKFTLKMMKRDDFRSLYLTAKRMIFSLHSEILEEIK